MTHYNVIWYGSSFSSKIYISNVGIENYENNDDNQMCHKICQSMLTMR